MVNTRPKPKNISLEPSSRIVLRDFMRVLQKELGIVRLRVIAAKCGLLGREYRKTSKAILKRLVPSSDKLTKITCDSLEERSRFNSALKMLQIMCNEAAKLDTLDHRAKVSFRRAQKALANGQYENLERQQQLLEELRRLTGHQLLAYRDLIIAFSLQDLDRAILALSREPDSQMEEEEPLPYDGTAPSPVAYSVQDAPSELGADLQAAPVEALDDDSTSAPPKEPEPGRAKVDLPPKEGPEDAHDPAHEPLHIASQEQTRPRPEPELPSTLPLVEDLSALRGSIQQLADELEAYSEYPERPEGLQGAVEEYQEAVQAAQDVRLEQGDSSTVEGRLDQSLMSIKEKATLIPELLRKHEGAIEEARKILARNLGVRSNHPYSGLAAVLMDFTGRAEKALDFIEHRISREKVTPDPQFALPLPEDIERQGLAGTVELLERRATQLRQARRVTATKMPIEATPINGEAIVLSAARRLPDPLFRSPHWNQEIARAELLESNVAPPFLPLRAPTMDIVQWTRLHAQASDAERATTVSHDLLRLLAGPGRSRPLSQALLLLEGVEEICLAASEDPNLGLFESCVVGLLFEMCPPDRHRAASRRRIRKLLKATTPVDIAEALYQSAEAAASMSRLPRVLAELNKRGLDGPVIKTGVQMASQQPGTARHFLGAYATALAIVGDVTNSRSSLWEILSRLNLKQTARDEVEDYLEDCLKLPRRTSQPGLQTLEIQPAAADLITTLGVRLWETGRTPGAKPKLGVSLPEEVLRDRLFVQPGSRYLDIPLRARNGGSAAAGGIVIALKRPLKGPSPIKSSEEIHVSWLSDTDLRDTASVITSGRIEIDPEAIDGDQDLRVTAQVSCFGGPTEAISLKVPVTPEEINLQFEEIVGYSGQPVDLNNQDALQASSKTVKQCFTRLQEMLHRGQPVRAVIHGRRRRGKSSICSSLGSDPAIKEKYLIEHVVWNSPKMESLETALKVLSGSLSKALSSAGNEVRPLDLSDLYTAEDLSHRYLDWLEGTCRRVKEGTPVLLIMDEFQKWLTGLPSPAERQAVLNVFRHFNEGVLGMVEVSFILIGLQNLRDLIKVSNDFCNAVDAYEIAELNIGETDNYIKKRIPIKLDFRSSRRLTRLSGGNPYVLNRLAGNLAQLLQRKERRWCTVLDLEELVEEAESNDSRLESYVSYMICEGEDDNAPTLPQLTVLRAVATCLAHRQDFDGYVRITDVEAWLDQQRVQYEEGLPAEHLKQLAQLGVLNTDRHSRFYLHGEWLCRQFAGLDSSRRPILPVTSVPEIDLVLGRYRKKRQISQGAQADLWQAENIEGGHDVVLKIYRKGTLDIPRIIRRESELLKRVKNRHVIRCLGQSMDDRHGGVVVLDWVEGKTLEEILRERPRSAADILPGGKHGAQLALMMKLAEGLSACHEVDVVHKDLSPDNIMLTFSGGIWEPVIIDFGLSGLETEPLDDGTSGLATPGYVAPEKLKGARRSKAADVFSLGAVFFKLLTGDNPNIALGPSEEITAEMNCSEVPQKVQTIVLQMLSGTPGKRPPAMDVRGLLDVALAPEGWRELAEAAAEAHLDDRTADAIALFERAVSSVPALERKGKKYSQLLGDAFNIICAAADKAQPWLTTLIDRAINLAADHGAGQVEWEKAVHELRGYCDRLNRESQRIWPHLVSKLDQVAPSESLVPLVIELGGGMQILRYCSEPFFEALSTYWSLDLVNASLVENHCVQASRDCRVRLATPLLAELWLQRARKLGHQLGEGYNEQDKQLANYRKRTRRVQTLPQVCHNQRVSIGKGEAGHLNVPAINALGERIFRSYPYVCELRRVSKDGGITVQRPTLLRLDNIANHLPSGQADPGNIIPLVLDGSFNPEKVALRMNIVLPADTTMAQRDAAYNMLSKNEELFDVSE